MRKKYAMYIYKVQWSVNKRRKCLARASKSGLFVRNDLINYGALWNVAVNELVKTGALLISSGGAGAAKARAKDKTQKFPRRDRALTTIYFSRNCRCVCIYSTDGPRTTLLPPDTYEPLSRGSLWLRDVEITGGSSAIAARGAPFERGPGYYLLIPSNGRTDGRTHDSHRAAAIISTQLKMKHGKSKQFALNPVRGAREILACCCSAIFERYDSLVCELITGCNNPARKLACHRKLWWSVDKVCMQTKRRRMRQKRQEAVCKLGFSGARLVAPYPISRIYNLHIICTPLYVAGYGKSASSFRRNFKIRKTALALSLIYARFSFRREGKKENNAAHESAIGVRRTCEKLWCVTRVQQRVGNNCRCRVIHAPRVING